MRGAYGSYSFDDNAIIIGTESRTMLDHGQRPYSRQVSHKVRGYLSGSSQSDITQKMNALITALAVPYQDFNFYMDSGALSATYLLNASSISGVRVIDGPDFVESRGSEYATQRAFMFTVQAEYALANTSNLLLYFTERIDFSGGGPRDLLREAIIGPPQKQRVREQTIFYAIQSGQAEGYTKEPIVPPPIWPGAMLENPMITRVSPARIGKGYQGYVATWSFRFGSATALSGRPHLWI